MAIEKLPAAPVNLSGGSLLSRQPSNIPEGGNALASVAEGLVKAYEPTLKAAAIKQAESDASTVVIGRGPNGEYLSPPEPDGGLVYDEVYNRAIDQSYASTIAYDFQMKADQIAAENYTDPQKAITLMNATMTGMTKGMDPRFVSIVTPVLQRELQQRAANVLNRKAGDDREALTRTTNTLLDTHINSYMKAWENGDSQKAEGLASIIKETARTAIGLNYYDERYLTALEGQLDIAKSRGLKAAEVADRTRRIEELSLAKAQRDSVENSMSVDAMGIILAGSTLLDDAGLERLDDVLKGDMRSLSTLSVANPDGTRSEIQLDTATFRRLVPDSRIRNEIISTVSNMRQNNDLRRQRETKFIEQRNLLQSVEAAAKSGIIPKYDAKQKDLIDSTVNTVLMQQLNRPPDLKNIDDQVIAVAAARHFVRTDTATVQHVITGIRSSDPAMLDSAIDIWGNLTTARKGKTDISLALTEDFSADDRRLLNYGLMLKKNKSLSAQDRIQFLEGARNGNIISEERIRKMYDKPYFALLQKNLAEELGLPSGDMKAVIPNELVETADFLTRTYAMSGDATAALKQGVKAAAYAYVADERSATGVGVRNFDSLVPPNIVDIVAKDYPQFSGGVLGKNVKYQVLNESNADTPIVRLILQDGVMVREVVDVDPVTDLPRPKASTELTDQQIRELNIRAFRESDAGRRAQAGVPLPTDPPVPLGFNPRTGEIYPTE